MILAATGHRPDKLGGYCNSHAEKLYYIARDFLIAREETLRGELTIISGMALGWDTAWALAGLNLKIPLIAAVPFIGQERRWPSSAQTQYHEILDCAVEIVIVSGGGYSSEKMQIRNEWMVDHCEELIALWDGSPGGTGNCIRYACKFKKPIINLWDHYNDVA